MEFDKCVLAFKKHFITDFNQDRLIATSLEGQSQFCRGILWKQFLRALPFNNNLTDWLQHTKSSRERYNKALKNLQRQNKNRNNDPLSFRSKVRMVIIYLG